MGKRAAAVILAVVLALLLSEGLLRLLSPAYAPRQPTYEIEPRGDSWVYVPGSQVVFEWDGDPYGTLPPGARQATTINAEGLRGPLPEPWRDCVVVLGDSFTFGEGVTDETTLPALLEEQLRDASGAGPACVNAGVSAHGSVEEAARLPELLVRFRPRAVVLVHVPNDAVPWNEDAKRAQANLLEPESPGPLRVLALIRAAGRGDELESWYRSFYDGENDEWYAFAQAALRDMAETCRRADVPFGVVFHPFLHRLDDYPLADITAIVRRDCTALGVPSHDLLPAFEGRDARELWVHPTDRHPNAEANALSAAHMAPFVRDLLR